MAADTIVDSVPARSETFSGADMVQELVIRYVGQILEGCGRAECTQTVCLTGRRNASNVPQRRYTPRSARAIAVALASGPRPRSRLCTYYQPCRDGSEGTLTAKSVEGRTLQDEGPIDPSSFVQQLFATKSINMLTAGPKATETRHDPHKTQLWTPEIDVKSKLESWHTRADEVCQSFHQSPPAAASGHVRLLEIVHEISISVLKLTRCFPQTDLEYLKYINSVVEDGCSVPQWQDHKVPRQCLRLLDALDDRPMCESLRRILDLIAKLRLIESDMRAMTRLHATESRSDTALASSWSEGSVTDHIASNIVEDGFSKTQQGFETLSVLLIWLKKTFLQCWNGEAIASRGSMLVECTMIINKAFTTYETIVSSADLRAFCNIPVIATRLRASDIAASWLHSDDTGRKTHLLAYRCLFTSAQRTTYFRVMNHLRMKKSHADAEKTSLMGRILLPVTDTIPEEQLKLLEQHYLLLSVSRVHVLQDAFDQLWQRHHGELLHPLRVRLGEVDELEVGHDLGGVQIEFFNLVCRGLFDESNDLFHTDTQTGISWFRAGSMQPLHMFELCGILIGLALYNGITLPISLPHAFYRRLLSQPCDILSHLTDAWPTIARSLEVIMADDVADLEAVLPLEANGLRLSVHAFTSTGLSTNRAVEQMNIIEASSIGQPSTITGAVDVDQIRDAWPGWTLSRSESRPEEISSRNKQEYVQRYMDWLTYLSVKPQFESFKRGFFRVIEQHTMSILTPEQLSALLEGSSYLDIDELRKATVYEDYDPKSRYIQSFWRVVSSWSQAKQKALLKFVTAVERVPTGGARLLTFKIQRATTSQDSLPTSSTCFGTLLLPKYTSTAVLEKKLDVALEYGLEGFGTG